MPPRSSPVISPVSAPAQPSRDVLAQPSRDVLAQGKLVIALDALLTRRNVTLAAKDLGLQVSAMSRLLAQLRQELDDDLFIRSGRGMVPTPYAETLRPRVRGIAQQLDSLFQRTPLPVAANEALDSAWNVPSPMDVPSLAFRSADLLEGEPSRQQIEEKLYRIGHEAPPHRRLARHVGVLGVAGGGNGRPLTTDEAEDALSIILAGEADPVQIGALFGMMRVRGTTAQELAGIVRAARAHVATRLGPVCTADVDWPCYTSPNYHNPPWFFHAARLLAQAGIRVVLHGATGTGDAAGRYCLIAESLGIPVCTTASQIAQALDSQAIAYIPLAALAPQIYRLIGLHRLLEARSVALEAVHMLHPVAARTSLLGVAKPTYKDLHRDTAKILGWSDLTIIGGTRDVAQFTPFRLTPLYRLVAGQGCDQFIPAVMREPAATPRPRGTSLEYWQGMWTGAMRDPRAEATIISSAACALQALAEARNGDFGSGDFGAWMERAAELWRNRRTEI